MNATLCRDPNGIIKGKIVPVNNKEKKEQPQIVLALVGSRNYTNYAEFKNIIAHTLAKWKIKISDISLVVSGDAKGADALAEKWAIEHKKTFTKFVADWKAYGTAAGPMRNTDIINLSTHVIAFPSREGAGTQDSIAKANNSNKKVNIFYID